MTMSVSRYLAGCLLALSFAGPAWAQSASPASEPALAVLDAPDGTRLEDIVSGQAKLGFTPVIARGVLMTGEPGRTTWMRLRLSVPEDGAGRFLRFDRQGFETLRLHAGQPAAVVADIAHPGPATAASRWPDAYALPLPEGSAGEVTLYVEAQGPGYLNLQPELLTGDELQARSASAAAGYRWLYSVLGLVLVLALVRHWRGSPRVLGVGLAAAACLVASLVANGHFQFSVGNPRLDSLGPGLPAAFWLMACAPLLWATRQYAGHDRNVPELAALLDRVGIFLLLAGLGALFVPAVYLHQLQLAVVVVMAVVAVLSVIALAFDPRRWRWGPILVWLGLLAALLALPLSMLQLLPASFLVRRGFELLLALLVALYLVLPWIRERLRERAQARRAVQPELSAEEKIARAREQLMNSLQAGLENAAEGDMEWIAYRRLLEGLKPVLPQVASAVVAMNYHNEDLLLVEPKAASERYSQLLHQRSTLLRNLSRLKAPQQVSIDFDGPQGPLPQVQLAVIPLPIDKPGWGALLIERAADVTYSDDELDLCAEFAALATTAGDEAAEEMQARKQVEIDAETGVYRREFIDAALAKQVDAAVIQRKPLSLLRVAIDSVETMAPEVLARVLPALVAVVREEVDYGDLVGRFTATELVVLAPEYPLGEARELAERICAGVRKQAIATAGGAKLTVSLGLSQLQPGERNPQRLVERAAQALAKARQYGGNQFQAVVSTTV